MIDSLKGSENLVQNKSKPLDGLPELNTKMMAHFVEIRFWRLSYHTLKERRRMPIVDRRITNL